MERWAELAVQGALAAALLLAEALSAPELAMSFLGLFAVLAQGYALGPRMLSQRSAVTTTVWGAIGSAAILMLARGALFYAGVPLLGWGNTAALVMMLVAGAAWMLFIRTDTQIHERAKETMTRPNMLIAVAALALSLSGAALIGWAAYKSGTTDAIRTPWPLVPPWLLPLIGLQWAFTLVVAWRVRNSIVSGIQAACAIASTAILAPLLYRIGYGFDGFLHVAGERVLAASGTLLPKPPYYMGQYVFVTWLSRLMDMDIATVDRWLVPAAAAMLIPAALVLVIGRERKRAAMLAALVLMPLSAFVATTPHGFASVLGVTALLLCIRTDDGMASRSLPLLLALWSLLTHPLVGLPVSAAVLMALVTELPVAKSLRMALAALLALAAGVSVPLVFGVASSAGSEAGVSFTLSALFNPNAWGRLAASWLPWVGNRYALWAEASVWTEKLLPWLTILFALAGTWRLWRTSRGTKNVDPPWLLASAMTLLAAIILKTAGDFQFLIDYEKGNYADRLFLIAWLLLLPVAIPELGNWLAKARHARLASAWAVVAAVALLGAGTSYASLPRHDAVTPSRGWSVGLADIEAVKLIQEDSEGRPYTVLANQSVSAAAVRTFGFMRYNGDVFLYPIPTGGKLYQLFLRASYEEPGRDIMSQAGGLGASRLVYFVVNDYWWKAQELSEQAEATANRTFIIGDGKIRIFRYDLDIPVQSATSTSK